MDFKYAEYGKFWQKIGSETYETMYQARPLLHDNFKNFLRNKKDVKTVLEVGCGTGIYPIKFKELFFSTLHLLTLGERIQAPSLKGRPNAKKCGGRGKLVDEVFKLFGGRFFCLAGRR